jgi:tripartite-type tricarboxylate transporter receptor subunit TctC
MTNFGRRMALSGVVLAAVVCATTAAVAEFPKRNVEFVVSAAAGGGNDVVTRMIAARLQQKWGKSVVVLNKPGVAVALAESYVANSAPDGHTVLFVNQTRTLNAAIGRTDAGYDIVNGLAAITQIGKQPFILVAKKNLPVKSMADLVALAKAKPNSVNYGDSGTNTTSDLAMKRLMQKTGTQLYEISYKTNADVVVAIMSGEIDIEFGDVLTTTPHIKAGSVAALGIADDIRSPVHPDLPTIAEALKLDSFVYTSWYGVFVARGTPKEIVDQLNEDIVSVIKTSEVQDALTRDGFRVIASKPDDFEAWLKQDTAGWKSVLDAPPPK